MVAAPCAETFIYGGREGHSRRRKIRRSAVGAPSGRRRATIGAKMRVQARERGCQYTKICVYGLHREVF